MNEIQNIESLKILLLAMSAILAISITLIGYFMSKRDNAITTATDNLTKANENLSTAVDQLKTIVNGLQLQYQIRQPIIDQQLEMHRKQIEEISKKGDVVDKRLSKIETEHKMFHCEYANQKRKKPTTWNDTERIRKYL